MRSAPPRRALCLAATLAAALASAGCPELNRQPAKLPGPEFTQQQPPLEGSDALDQETQVLIAQQGELPDRPRRARWRVEWIPDPAAESVATSWLIPGWP